MIATADALFPALWGVLYALGALYGLWTLYLAIMALQRAHESRQLRGVAKWAGLPLVLAGYALDAFVNLTVFSVLFLERPREWLVTQRLQRHVRHGTGRRQRLARWVCAEFLDTFDPAGSHCGR